ncbi:hypothetical protein AZE42_09086 [Rhizopogon vesiculosus]|uniref:3-phytase n=1 Tax=Rhizopogon vesiculosus TaxID=180088 RepID=A0A1J8QKV8_9AGAM|nr:hypothetical protein AZE42_09086 [Rhizopogon vesiculosus]
MTKEAGYTPLPPPITTRPNHYRILPSFPIKTVASLSLTFSIVLLFVKFLLRSAPLSELQQFWGPHTPYYSVEEYHPPPDGFRPSPTIATLSIQVNIIQRHGARYPTNGASNTIQKGLRKLLSASEYHDVKLEFLRSYKWHLGVADLVPFGAAQ